MKVTCTLAEWLERGPALVAAGCDEVEITDKEPLPDPPGRGWAWMDSGCSYRRHSGMTYQLPTELFGMLPGVGTGAVGPGRYFSEAPGMGEARAALSAACLAWARAAPAAGPANNLAEACVRWARETNG